MRVRIGVQSNLRETAQRMEVRALVESTGGKVIFVALTVPAEKQERRLVEPSRATFGKMQSLDLLHSLRGQFAECVATMPKPILPSILGSPKAEDAARAIVAVTGLGS